MKRSGSPSCSTGTVLPGLLQGFQHGAARAAHDDVLLHRHQQVVGVRQLADESVVERLHETHVGDRGVELLGRLQRGFSMEPKARIAILFDWLADALPLRRISPRPIGRAVISFLIATPGPVPRG